MELPDKPINWEKTLKSEGDKVFKLITDRDLFKIVEYPAF